MNLTDTRSTVEKRVDEIVLERVKKGIALLEEKYGPDFADHIDLNTLDLRDGESCVLGQLYANAEPTEEQWEAFYRSEATQFLSQEAGYSRGLAIIDGDLLDDAGESCGFNDLAGNLFDELQTTWVDLLAERRVARQRGTS